MNRSDLWLFLQRRALPSQRAISSSSIEEKCGCAEFIKSLAIAGSLRWTVKARIGVPTKSTDSINEEGASRGQEHHCGVLRASDEDPEVETCACDMKEGEVWSSVGLMAIVSPNFPIYGRARMKKLRR